MGSRGIFIAGLSVLILVTSAACGADEETTSAGSGGSSSGSGAGGSVVDDSDCDLLPCSSCRPGELCWVYPKNTGADLFEVQAVDAEVMWALGDAHTLGTIVRYHADGSAEVWNTPEPVHHLWAASAEVVWVTGPGGLCRRDESGWTLVDDSVYGDLWGRADDDLYVIDGDQVLHWDGQTLSPLPGSLERSPTGPEPQICGTGESDLWVLHDPGVSHFDGMGWTHHPLTDAELLVCGLDGSVFAVERGSSTTRGTFHHLLDGQWVSIEHGSSGVIDDVAVASPERLWVPSGFSAIETAPGPIDQEWGLPEDPNRHESLIAVDMVSPTEGWATGQAGVVWRYVAGGWERAGGGHDRELQEIVVVDDERWIISEHFLHHFDGEGWQRHELSFPWMLRGIPEGGVLVAVEGELRTFAGAGWTTLVELATLPGNLQDAHAGTDVIVLALNDGGVMTMGADGALAPVADLPGSASRVWGRSVDDFYALNSEGEVWRHDGVSWQFVVDSISKFPIASALDDGRPWVLQREFSDRWLFPLDGGEPVAGASTKHFRDSLNHFALRSSQDIWATTEDWPHIGYYLYAYDGAEWSEKPLPNRPAKHSLAVSADATYVLTERGLLAPYEAAQAVLADGDE